MGAPGLDTIVLGYERLRIAPWRGHPDVAYLTPAPDSVAPSTALVQRCLATLAAEGFRRAVTGALSPGEADAFLGAGFAVIECLNLLAHDLHSIPEGPRTALQRVGPHRQAEVLRLDALSFPPFWQLDTAGLHEALTATAHSRFRMVAAGGAPIAYAIVGRAGRRGYLQRLAVHPDSRRAGLATALVVDGLRWARRWGVHRVVVNTQVDNTAALALYEALGFRVQPGGLSVLAAAVPTPA